MWQLVSPKASDLRESKTWGQELPSCTCILLTGSKSLSTHTAREKHQGPPLEGRMINEFVGFYLKHNFSPKATSLSFCIFSPGICVPKTDLLNHTYCESMLWSNLTLFLYFHTQSGFGLSGGSLRSSADPFTSFLFLSFLQFFLVFGPLLTTKQRWGRSKKNHTLKLWVFPPVPCLRFLAFSAFKLCWELGYTVDLLLPSYCFVYLGRKY